jgi:endosialidase-like protein
MRIRSLGLAIVVFLLLPVMLIAQVHRDEVRLTSWTAPLYWQPSLAESRLAENVAADTIPANALVFVGMAPCRVLDTRNGSGFIPPFGPPSLIGGTSRSFPIQASTTCTIPSIAQAYSFNITVVPAGFLDYITVWPSGQLQPFASTLNGYVGTVIANAAIVPAGTGGSIDVFASQNTDLIVDINGYYAPQSGITLTQGSAGTPSMSFFGDPGTGIFSSGGGTLNIATSGTNRLTVRSDGDLDLTGSIRRNGALWLHSLGTANTGVGLGTLPVNTGQSNTATGTSALGFNTGGSFNTATGGSALQFNTTGNSNTATGFEALISNSVGFHNVGTGFEALDQNMSGFQNTAIGFQALFSNTSGSGNTGAGWSAGGNNTTGTNNTFIGFQANPSGGGLTNATAIGNNAVVNASNKIRLGNDSVTVLEAKVGLTVTSDKNEKENFRSVNAEDVLKKLAGVSVPSWNYIGNDPKQFRHYGPMAQDFFAAFGKDEVGTIGTPTTINSADLSGILMLAVQALEKRSTELQKDNETLQTENQTLEDRLKAQEERILRLEAARGRE